MNLGKLLVTGVIILVAVAMVRSFVSDVQKNTPPPTHFIIRADVRIAPDQTQLIIRNTNNFPWKSPIFWINDSYRCNYPKPIMGGETVQVPFQQFKDETGQTFKDAKLFGKNSLVDALPPRGMPVASNLPVPGMCNPYTMLSLQP